MVLYILFNLTPAGNEIVYLQNDDIPFARVEMEVNAEKMKQLFLHE